MKMYLVKWIDAATYYGGWMPRSEVDHLKATMCISQGIVIKESNSEITLCPNLNPNNMSCLTTIPKVAIKRIWQLEVKDA